jgi:hypothetical protein
LLFVVTGAFTNRTNSTERRGANLIRVFRITRDSGKLVVTEFDRIEFGEDKALVAADLDASGNWIHVIVQEDGCGVLRIPWTNESLLHIARERLNGLPKDNTTLSGTLESIMSLRHEERY